MRGLAALAVLFHHVLFTSIPYEKWPLTERLAGTLSHFGMYGVDLFFVLSGFLITSLLLQDRGSGSYFHDFYWKRALRILPLYVVVLIGAAITERHSPAHLASILLCVFFAANFAQVFHLPREGPFWTLAIEEQFYLLWPMIVRKVTAERLSRLALGIVAAEFVLRLASAVLGHRDYVFTFYHCDGLALGAYLACRFRSWNTEGDKPAEARRTLGGAAIVSVLCFGVYGILSADAQLRFGDAILLSGVACLFFAVTGSVARKTGSKSLALLRSKPLLFLGAVSYAFYMVHLYVLKGYDHFVPAPAVGDHAAYVVRLCAVLGLSLVLSVVSRYVIELPAQSLRRYVLRERGS